MIKPLWDLGSHSDIISFNGQTTLGSEDARCCTPGKFGGPAQNHQPGAQIVGLADFFALNRGWITTVEVSLRPSEGNEPASPRDSRKRIGKSGNLIVATYQAGPISVMPPQTPAVIRKRPLTVSQ